MNPYYGTTEDITNGLARRKAPRDTEQWRRWDEELVEKFGRWLGRIVKVIAILFLAVSAAVIISLF
ncbi:MAG: hypothetical protein HWN69_01540 [Desulfobacterales bacterium]|nr:hypothetical protein [Desulfobacterales bacterium]